MYRISYIEYLGENPAALATKPISCHIVFRMPGSDWSIFGATNGCVVRAVGVVMTSQHHVIFM